MTKRNEAPIPKLSFGMWSSFRGQLYYIDLDKSVQTLINESTVALAAGCNGIAYAMLKAFPGT